MPLFFILIVGDRCSCLPKNINPTILSFLFHRCVVVLFFTNFRQTENRPCYFIGVSLFVFFNCPFRLVGIPVILSLVVSYYVVVVRVFLVADRFLSSIIRLFFPKVTNHGISILCSALYLYFQSDIILQT